MYPAEKERETQMDSGGEYLTQRLTPYNLPWPGWIHGGGSY